MVKIRLMRIGAKKRPFYRVVAVDERLKRTGAYLELLGTYNPLTTPHEIILKQDRIDVWIKQGAQMSDGFLRIIGKAPQKPPRKPKKEKEETKPANDKPTEVNTPEASPQIAQEPTEETTVNPEVETQTEAEIPSEETKTPEEKNPDTKPEV